MVGISNCILAKECKYLCEINKIVNDVKDNRKNQKREVNITAKKKFYHLHDKYDIKMAKINK